jgi:hypothetical protein
MEWWDEWRIMDCKDFAHGLAEVLFLQLLEENEENHDLRKATVLTKM